jgi:hypothetical protein
MVGQAELERWRSANVINCYLVAVGVWEATPMEPESLRKPQAIWPLLGYLSVQETLISPKNCD